MKYEFNGSPWSRQTPTPTQLNAIDTYNKGYGIEINCKSKQDAHNIIKVFVPKQVLEFEGNVIKGTNVTFNVIDEQLFSKRDKLNSGLDILEVLQVLNRNMFDMIENPSFSEEEDALGYLSPEEIEHEMDMYGVDPILTGKL